MTSPLPILVAFDGSSDAEQALAWACDEASRTGVSLRVVMVDDERTLAHSRGDFVGRDQQSLDRAEKMLSDAGVHDGKLEQVSGHVVAELLQRAESASMLVVGSRGHGRVGEVLAGSVSQHLARHATCSVVVVRSPAAQDSDRIVVGVDASAASDKAVEFACMRAELTGAVVVAVHGWRVHAPSTDVWSSAPWSVEDADSRQLLLAEAVAGTGAAHPDVELLQEAIPVAPGQVLVDASAGASLVVVGSHGRGFFSGLLLGSVSQEVVQRAHCSVAVIR